MADLNLSLILKLVDRATGPARAAMRAIERIGGESVLRQAAKAQAASAMIAGGVGSIAGAATRGGLAVAAYGAGITALAASFVRPAAQFEQFTVQLTTLEGSSEKASAALDWIETFATKTPLSVEQTVSAYARLKAFGLDPTTGSLQAMVDTMSATGGGAEKLDGLTLALGQAWTKGKLQGEEAMQMLERGVPVWDLLAQSMGKSAAEVQQLSEQGKLGREEITLLMEALGSKYSGASEKASETWDGIISNLFDQWTRFQRAVMASGLFVWMKGQLNDLLDLLNTMAANGELQAWAEATGRTIMNALIGLKDFGVGIYDTLDRIQTAIGGWDILAWTGLMLAFAPSLLAVAGAITAIGKGLLALTANPLFWIVAGTLAVIAGFAWLAYQTYKHWDEIVAYLGKQMMWISDKLNELGVWLEEWAGKVGTWLYDAFMSVDLFAEGAHLIQTLWDGMKAPMEQMLAWATEKIDGIVPDWLRNADAGGAAVIGDEGGYGGMAGAMDGGFDPSVGLPPARALGGPVRAGVIHQWQEEGRELFVPDVDGRVISNRQLRSLRGGGQGRAAPAFHIGAINITAAAGQSARDVGLAVRRELEDMARGAPLHDGGGYGD